MTFQVIGNESMCRELAYTGRVFSAAESVQMGFVSRVVSAGSRRQHVVQAALDLADEIARQSPVAVFGTKQNLIFSRDHSVADGLEYAATWNGAALQAEDLEQAMKAGLSKSLEVLRFSKL